jgi:hypothetical protein
LTARYANSPLKPWFDQLASGNGLCCSFADGVSVQGVDWDTQDGHYRVRLHREWIVVPDAEIVTEPNRFGPAVVWPYQDDNDGTKIRCFIPGAGAKHGAVREAFSEAEITRRDAGNEPPSAA